MMTEPPPEDDHWRTEALTRMERSGAVLDRTESNEPYPVEDNSDLAADREQIPDLWLDTVATRRLKVAVDYLAGVSDLVSGGLHYYAFFRFCA
ncbi:MAG: hypothetical protein HZB45_28205 [Mycolicibacterium rufum]|nr:hypothetical protein [Mycolicibacterium rufum]